MSTNNLDGIVNKDYTINNIILSDLTDPFFRLRAMCRLESSSEIACLMEMQHQLEEINIALDIEPLDWPTLVGQIVAFREFDLLYLRLYGEYLDPDFRGVYSENGSLNLFGYHTSMDYNETLGTGLNEWYLDHGVVLMPPDGVERVEHYYEWQNYMMDEILPSIPLFSTNIYKATWSELNGYNLSKGLLQSWGNMSWSGLHGGQKSTSEIVIEDEFWNELNPLRQSSGAGDDASRFISDACMDPLIKIDSDGNFFPHIISDWTHINSTHVRLDIREGIKWQTDPDSLFTDEYVNVEDVYFTLFSWMNIAEEKDDFDMIKSLEIIDDYTLDIFIGNSTYQDSANLYLQRLRANVLPEHYLNQTQMPDGKTPDITHSSWLKFNQSCFGTGLFEIEDYAFEEATNLTVWNDCWRLNDTITSDPALDWENRYGDFSGGLTDLRVLYIADPQWDPYEKIIYFENGMVDLIDITDFPTQREEYISSGYFTVESTLNLDFVFSAFNMRESRGTPMQSSDPCPHNPSMTKGLAIRKAIAYAINRTILNDVAYNGEYEINDYPIQLKQEKWLNPDIIKYDFNLATAKEYMMYAGFETGLDSDGDGLTDITELETTFTDRLDADTDSDTLTDGDEVNLYSTDPLVADYILDSDSDGLTNVEEVDIYETNPMEEDSDGDGMDDFWEVEYGTNPISDDSFHDPDFDGLVNINEYSYGTDPMNDDSDGDNIEDGEEVLAGADNYITDPLDEDTDGDGILDGEEVVLGSDGYATNPMNEDTDGDGTNDAEEIANGTDPTISDEITGSPTPTDTGGIGVIFFIPAVFICMIGLIFARKNKK